MSGGSRPVILCLEKSGLAVARRAARGLGGDLHAREGVCDGASGVRHTPSFLREVFLAGRPIIGICAAGILIRCLAPCLRNKTSEPPVVAGSETGASWIPLLGGHRGANRLASRLAGMLGGHAALTTAGDLRFGLALDEPPDGWAVVNRERAGPLMASLLSGAALAIGGEEAGAADWLSPLPRREGSPDVEVGMAPPVSPQVLGLVPRRAALGVGCVRGASPASLLALARSVLAEAAVATEALCGVFSVDRKADEPAVIALATSLRAPLRFFSAAELEAETPRVANPSSVVHREMGCHSVAEAAALAGAGPDSVLRVQKRKCAQATCALAVAPEPIQDIPGRRRGRLMLVSAGPGTPAWRTQEASQMVAEAEELVGYGPYVELLGAAGRSRPARAFRLGEEEDRCRYAISRASEGRQVALVCSGDAGIYAMAALVYQLLDTEGEALGALTRGIEVQVTPGISAAMALAARLGAPLGHDFCAVSLSDYLTPREVILQRIEAAARAGFVLAFYNPASARRQSLLEEARHVLLQFRAPETPVSVGRKLGREGECVRCTTLGALRVSMADMHSIVLVGASTTRRIETPDGPRLYTPRGYRTGPTTGKTS